MIRVAYAAQVPGNGDARRLFVKKSHLACFPHIIVRLVLPLFMDPRRWALRVQEGWLRWIGIPIQVNENENLDSFFGWMDMGEAQAGKPAPFSQAHFEGGEYHWVRANDMVIRLHDTRGDSVSNIPIFALRSPEPFATLPISFSDKDLETFVDAYVPLFSVQPRLVQLEMWTSWLWWNLLVDEQQPGRFHLPTPASTSPQWTEFNTLLFPDLKRLRKGDMVSLQKELVTFLQEPLHLSVNWIAKILPWISLLLPRSPPFPWTPPPSPPVPLPTLTDLEELHLLQSFVNHSFVDNYETLFMMISQDLPTYSPAALEIYFRTIVWNRSALRWSSHQTWMTSTPSLSPFRAVVQQRIWNPNVYAVSSGDGPLSPQDQWVLLIAGQVRVAKMIFPQRTLKSLAEVYRLTIDPLRHVWGQPSTLLGWPWAIPSLQVGEIETVLAFHQQLRTTMAQWTLHLSSWSLQQPEASASVVVVAQRVKRKREPLPLPTQWDPRVWGFTLKEMTAVIRTLRQTKAPVTRHLSYQVVHVLQDIHFPSPQIVEQNWEATLRALTAYKWTPQQFVDTKFDDIVDALSEEGVLIKRERRVMKPVELDAFVNGLARYALTTQPGDVTSVTLEPVTDMILERIRRAYLPKLSVDDMQNSFAWLETQLEKNDMEMKVLLLKPAFAKKAIQEARARHRMMTPAEDQMFLWFMQENRHLTYPFSEAQKTHFPLWTRTELRNYFHRSLEYRLDEMKRAGIVLGNPTTLTDVRVVEKAIQVK